MKLSIKKYDTSLANNWDNFVENSNGGTIFHRLDFLKYHRNYFSEKEHHLIFQKGQSIFGIMPLVIEYNNGSRIALSPYGGSYGGPIFKRPLSYYESMSVIMTLLGYLNEINIEQFRMTLPIASCYITFCQTLHLAFLENGFKCINRDISSVVNLENKNEISEIMSSRARNMVRKAIKNGVRIDNRANVADFWSVLETTYKKHGVSSTHSFEEWQWLCNNLPDNIFCNVAYLNGKPIAGIGCIIINSQVKSSFYLCQDPEYQTTQALSLIVYESLLSAQKMGFRWFDFGTSSINQIGRSNVFMFKESFGAIGVFRETYIWRQSDLQ